MLELSGFAVLAAGLSIALATACYATAAALGRVLGSQLAPARGASQGGSVSVSTRSGADAALARRLSAAGLAGPLAGYGSGVAWLGLGFLTLALAARTIATGHAPFANMYEFSLAFGWGLMAAYLYIDARYRERALGLVALPISLLLIWYATTLPSTAAPLVPALQNSFLLTVHVATAILAYGAFGLAFAAAVLRLVGVGAGQAGRVEVLDRISYRCVVVGFPSLTLTIALGAVWADMAWGSYWSWDPKETASLVTWFIFGAYLHARVIRGWRGERAAWLMVAGFGAVLFTFFGNLFLGGLHAYSGV